MVKNNIMTDEEVEMMVKHHRLIREKNVLVRLTKLVVEDLKERAMTKEHPFKEGEAYVYLGEIKNMADHGIFVDNDGKVLWGYHVSDFEEIPDGET